jgi:ADP-heptose:LPS heptosyltransferase
LKYKSFLKEFLLHIRDLFLWIFDKIFMVLKENENANSTVIVRVDNIGDFVLWLPSAEQLTSHYATEIKPILICNESCIDIANSINYFSRVIGVELSKFSQNLFYRWHILRTISELSPRIIIQPSYSRFFSIGDSIIRVSRASERIGSVGDLSNISSIRRIISNRWYTKLVSASATNLMELERNTEFNYRLGIINSYTSIPKISKICQLSSSKKIHQDFFVIFPGSSSAYKSWPVASFAKIAIRIVEKYGWTPVILGGCNEFSIGEQLEEKLIKYSSKNYVGKTTLTELVEILRTARVLVSNDTSAIHIAASVNTPSACILGGGHYGRFLPYPDTIEGIKPAVVINKMSCFGCNWHCKFSNDTSLPYPCISGIEVDSVFETVESIIEEKKISQKH